MDIPQTWTFDRKEVADAFDAHVREQLPWYDLVTGAIAHLARHYVQPKGRIYDVGASTGNIGKALQETITDREAKFIPVENAQEMVKIYDGPGTLEVADAQDYEFKDFDLCVCMLVMMFVPMDERGPLLDRLISRCKKGGAIIIVDRIATEGGYADTALYRMTLAGKIAGGASPDDIIAKEMSLGGVQRPLEARELPGGLKEWFRFGHFKAWIYEG